LYDTVSAFKRASLVYQLQLLVGVSKKKKSLKVSGGIASQDPLGRSLCPVQEASPACRYRMTRLYMPLPIDENEAGQKPDDQNESLCCL